MSSARSFLKLTLCLLLAAFAGQAQSPAPISLSVAAISDVPGGDARLMLLPLAPPPPPPQDIEPTRFNWVGAARQSFYFLSVQHSLRMVQPKTRAQLSGPFFEDWKKSIQGIRGWRDGDSMFTNYVAHPMQGGVSGYIQIQNDPRGRKLEIGRSKEYWQSRLRAMGFAALYSTTFEIGPISEATIGNVGMKRGTSGFVDFVVTPTGGMGMVVAEDWLDRYVVKPLESRTQSAGKRRFYRTLFNPQRSFANVLRGKLPWHRDTRPLRDDDFVQKQSPQPAPALSPERNSTN